MEKKFVEILWTGGFDSTYRMIQLSRMDVIVQPYYLIFDYRESRLREMYGVRNMHELLTKRSDTVAEIKAPIFVDAKNIPKNKECEAAWRAANSAYGGSIGKQIRYISRFALEHPGIEMALQKEDARDFTEFKSEDPPKELTYKKDDTYLVDPNLVSKDVFTLYRNLTFPIIKMTEKKMLENLKKMNYEDVLSFVWFCQHSINDKPCGYCVPCLQKRLAGMEYLLPKEAQKRAKTFTSLLKIFGYTNTRRIFDISRKLHLSKQYDAPSDDARIDVFSD